MSISLPFWKNQWDTKMGGEGFQSENRGELKGKGMGGRKKEKKRGAMVSLI